MAKKDPYLKELETMDDLQEENDEGVEVNEEPTSIDFEAPPLEEGSQTIAEPSSGEILDLSSDVPVQMVVVMGRRKMTVKELLGFRTGHVVDLERMPNEAVDLVANGRVIGKGELVEIDGKLGVRILKLLK